MKRIVVCYKWVLDEAYIRLNADMTLDTNQVDHKISDYDRNAIEAGVQAAKALEGTTMGLTFGTAEAKQSLKAALSRGLDESCWVNAEEASQADGAATASALAGAISRIEDVSLVICAEGASDTFARQTAPRIGALLDLPVVTSVCAMELLGNTLLATRKLKDSTETLEVELPCVVAVLPEVNAAPIPGLKAVLAAGKKPVTELTPEDIEADLSPRAKVEQVRGYVMDRKNVVLKEGSAQEKVTELLAHLRKEGVL
ncbi:MAG: electron transfer flavoprotein beta subunit/FixA family protein [Coriobacteriia bacterium]|nr:electron transfer flavoprotein beta subunit/FixA family protein [Coriobacteriia bacterium]